MGLSSDLISQFVKATKDDKKKSTEATVYGKVVEQNGEMYVQLDGSDVLTPVTSTVKMESGERVVVTIKDHSAVVTGNLTTHSASSKDVEDIVDEISEFEIVIADQIDAVYARIDTIVAGEITTEKFNAEIARIEALIADSITAEELEAELATIEQLIAGKLDAEIAEITYATIEDLEATNAIINNLDATYATIVDLEAERARIDYLEVNKLSVEDADLRYANIDFSNIGEAAIEYLYAQSGLIEDVIISEGTITGTLVGVTIKGDLIEGGTIVADKLVIKGDDGLYYKLNTDGSTVEAEQTEYNSLDGSVITAKSITATKIAVDDLVAFDATIGGFNITSKSLYSGVKESIDNSTRGIYLDTDGQMYIGDASNYLRYYKDVDEDGNEVFRLEISAESILFGANSKSSAEDLKTLTEHVRISTYEDPETGDVRPAIELAEGDSDFKQVITNVKTVFMNGSTEGTEINTDGVETDNLTVRDELRHGNWVWAQRANGNYGLRWRGVTE